MPTDTSLIDPQAANYKALGIPVPDDSALAKTKKYLGQAETAYEKESKDPDIARLREKKAKMAEESVGEDIHKAIEPFNPQAAPKASDYATDPVQSFFSLGSVFGILASAFTHSPWTTSMDAAAAAINARTKGDTEAYKYAFDEWNKNTDMMFKRHEAQSSDWRLIQEKHKDDQGALDAALTAHEAKYEDDAAKALRLSGQYAQYYDLMSKRESNYVAMKEKMPDLIKAGMSAGALMEIQNAKKSGDPAKYNDALKNYQELQASFAGIKSSDLTGPLMVDVPDGKGGTKKIPAMFNKQSSQFYTADGTMTPINNVAGASKIAAASQSSTMSDEAADLIADQVIAGNRQALAGLARNASNVTKVNESIARKAKAKGLSGADLARVQAEFQGVIQGERTTALRTANMEIAANEVKNMAPLALEASKKVSRTEYPTLNSIIVATERGTGDENVVRFGLATNSLIYTYSKFLNPTGIPTDADKARATDILSTAWSQGQFAAAIDQIKKEIQSGQAALKSTTASVGDKVTGKTSQENPALPTNEKEYNALPSGAYYRKPDDPLGSYRVKP